MTRAARLAPFFLVLTAVGAIPLAAQPDPDRLSRQELLQRIQSEFQSQIARELQLSADQRAALSGILSEFGVARREVGELREAFVDRVNILLDGDGPDPVQAMALIEEGRALRAREEELLAQEEERLLEILEPSQVLLLQVLRDRFGDLIETVGNRDAIEGLYSDSVGALGGSGIRRP